MELQSRFRICHVWRCDVCSCEAIFLYSSLRTWATAVAKSKICAFTRAEARHSIVSSVALPFRGFHGCSGRGWGDDRSGSWVRRRAYIAAKTRAGEFGKGSIRGLAAPETPTRPRVTGSFVPLLTLGIPGSGTTAMSNWVRDRADVTPGATPLIDEPADVSGCPYVHVLGNFRLVDPETCRCIPISQGLAIPAII